MSDPLMSALALLADPGGHPVFDAIRWCPEQHVLSFRRVGDDDEWVNLWLHATPDLNHVAERNGAPGGSADSFLWRDGEHTPAGFVFNIPRRRDPTEMAADLLGRVEYHNGWVDQ